MSTELRKFQELAAKANSFHERFEKVAGQAINFARTIGELLLDVKARLDHGEFEDWIEVNCTFSLSTARGYMRVANNWPTIVAKQGDSPDIGLREALSLLVKPKITDQSKQQRVAVLTEETLDIPLTPSQVEHQEAWHDAAASIENRMIQNLEMAKSLRIIRDERLFTAGEYKTFKSCMLEEFGLEMEAVQQIFDDADNYERAVADRPK